MNQLDTVRAAFTVQARGFSQPGLTVTDSHHLNWMLEVLDFEGPHRILDVAAGTGLLSFALSPRVRSVVALDATPAMIEEGARAASRAGLTNVAFVTGLAEQLSVGSETFDAVVCRFAVHHFAEPAEPVDEMIRACRTGGSVTLIDLVSPDDERLGRSYNRLEKLRDSSHSRALTRAELEDLLRERGLRIDQPASREISVPLERWLALTKTEDETRRAIRENLEAELRKRALTGLRPFMHEGEMYFWQTWVVVTGRK